MATLTARPIKGPAAWHGQGIEPGALRGGIEQPRSA